MKTKKKVLKKESDKPESFIIKGRRVEKKCQIGDAELNYEQAAKSDDGTFVGKALFKLTKMRLREKDYYEAYFDMRRIRELTPKIELYKVLIDGIVSLMKKKHIEGINYFDAIEGKLSALKIDMKYIYHIFKAYGYMTQHKFEVK